MMSDDPWMNAHRRSVLGSPEANASSIVANTVIAICVALSLLLIVLGLMIVRQWHANAKAYRETSTIPTAKVRGPVPARALNDEVSWIDWEDYPAFAIRANQQGTVTIEWTIGTDGRVHHCRAARSSGVPSLDTAACRALTSRARYSPAIDANGRAIPQTQHRRVVWRLPD